MSVLVCPVCQGQMREVSHESVLIDTCTQCRGVWLDRGELEKLSGLIEASAGRPAPGSFLGGGMAMDQQRYRNDDSRRYRDDDDDDDHRGRHGDYRRKSKVSRFLDFFD